jgi:hypothetical protein
MVTANLNHERRTSSIAESEDDETNNRQIQTRLVSISYYSFGFYSDIDTSKKKEDYSSTHKCHHFFY